ncbi:uncharacterized protein BJ171DRAFT_491889 [Polychytrium aggregatum]|uniref:uncharacterized protein n=1 Tax=Polychytrium aggregatum TaxID=110093 RepID=UPI0022FDE12E|nr:uncharacterized protein BJ171DRAFT_491889 [Polychytrium aggregatum]KAI9207879.1 hypothetical protein BJ171DRAFT_491889 [Polychytrium aggregatum]
MQNIQDIKNEKGLPMPPPEQHDGLPEYQQQDSTLPVTYQVYPNGAPSTLNKDQTLPPVPVAQYSAPPVVQSSCHGSSSKSAQTSFAIMGGTDLDLINTKLVRGGTYTINAASLLGGITIRVPADVEVVNQGVAILGGIGIHKNPYYSGLPTSKVVIRGVAIMGGVSVEFSDKLAQYQD